MTCGLKVAPLLLRDTKLHIGPQANSLISETDYAPDAASESVPWCRCELVIAPNLHRDSVSILCTVGSESGGCIASARVPTHQRLNGALNFLTDPLAGDLQIVLCLQVLPELRSGSEVARQP
jgi:hypothetical protein